MVKLKSPLSIAKFLIKRKVTGIPQETRFCPIAMFLGNKRRVSVGEEIHLYHSSHAYAKEIKEVKIKEVKCTKPMKEFIKKFDDGTFPRKIQHALLEKNSLKRALEIEEAEKEYMKPQDVKEGGKN